MLDQISELMKQAMKDKNRPRLNALRYIKSLLTENKTATKPIEPMDVVIKHHKKLKDSLDLYVNDATKLEEIKSEMAVVEEFMPRPLEEADVQKIIGEIVQKLEKPNMGLIMKELQPQIKGRFDGKRASDMVKAVLS